MNSFFVISVLGASLIHMTILKDKIQVETENLWLHNDE